MTTPCASATLASMKALALATALAVVHGGCGCNAVLDDPHFSDYACSAVDCTDPTTAAAVAALPDHGAVAAAVECSTVAVSAAGVTARVYYQATRLVDGACFASATIGAGPGGLGLGADRAVGASFAGRGDPAAATCRVRAYLPGFAVAVASVEAGQLHVESPACGGGAGCVAAVATACTGDVEAF